MLTHPGRLWSNGFVSIQVSEVCQAIDTFSTQFVTVLGDTVLQVTGLPIGAIISSPTVNINLDFHEASTLEDTQKLEINGFGCLGQSFQQHVAWVRYVDDFLVQSRTLCVECLQALVYLSCPMKLTIMSGSGSTGNIHIIADIQVVHTKDAVILLQKC